MSDSEPSKVYMFSGSDPEMLRANEKARETFRYFWREMAWENRRIVPALDLACVKAPFSDGEYRTGDGPEVEHMWISEVQFDGEAISGVLLNSPNWLKTVKEGDSASFRLNEISDWMYAISGEVYGAYTVNLLRSRMSARERKDHDEAWGMNFGDPAQIRLVPEPKKKGLFGGAKKADPDDEHPMSANMAPSLKEQIKKVPSFITDKDDDGWTILHHLALAGSLDGVKVLLAAGADRHAPTNDGKTPAALARTLGWSKVVALLDPC